MIGNDIVINVINWHDGEKTLSLEEKKSVLKLTLVHLFKEDYLPFITELEAKAREAWPEEFEPPVCKTCHGNGGYYEDVVGDGGPKMWIECEDCDGVKPEDDLTVDEARQQDKHNRTTQIPIGSRK